ncbi:MAG: hypothetical protein G01um101438_612 [Parcubacteria group bacterium Gr01-1014_38]|nr:MAG: hypothetical protein G01um101438_612 [Parcubacteria group bacterium Gr01-1014_38]
MLTYFPFAQRGSNFRKTCRITNSRRCIADNKNNFMSKLLKFQKFSKDNCVPQMKIWSSWINTKLYTKLLASP